MYQRDYLEYGVIKIERTMIKNIILLELDL